jgi:hypothetical protein
MALVFLDSDSLPGLPHDGDKTSTSPVYFSSDDSLGDLTVPLSFFFTELGIALD